MKKYFNSGIGRLRMVAILEGTTFLILLFIGVPMKHLFDLHLVNQIFGPIHGGLFIAYVILALMVSVELNWKFTSTTFKVLIASVIPFGTFWIDKKVLSPAHQVQD